MSCFTKQFVPNVVTKAVVGFSLLFSMNLQVTSAADFNLSFPGYTGQAKVNYDEAGIPHIKAQSREVGYAGFCWAMAHDRLFQMDFFRRIALGKFSEVFGAGPNNSFIGQDIFFRTFSLKPAADMHYAASSPQRQSELTACAVGVNKFINDSIASNSLPPEFGDLNYQPEQWTAQDSLVAIEFVVTGLDQLFIFTKTSRAAIAGLVGQDIADTLIPEAPDDISLFDANGNLRNLFSLSLPGGNSEEKIQGRKKRAMMIPQIDKDKYLGNLDSLNLALAYLKPYIFRGSNNFVVDGFRSKTRKPIAANDLHVPHQTPSLLYFADVEVEDQFKVTGVTGAPGFPGFITGDNRHVAWTGTFVIADDADFYVEQTRVENGVEQVYYQGQWVDMIHRNETINVAGGTPVNIVVRVTPHGPVFSDAIPPLQAFGTLALKGTYAQPEWTVDGIFELPSVRNWESFRTAVNKVGFGLNYIYADKKGDKGHIGYQMAGLMPQRNLDNTYVPVSGSDGLHEWTGYATQDQMPHVFDPSTHYLGSSNHRIVPSDYAPNGTPIYISRYWDQPWRALRAIDLVKKNGNRLTADDMGSFQYDHRSVIAPQIKSKLVAAINRVGLPAGDPDAAQSLSELSDWNGKMGKNSRGALIYEVTMTLLMKNMVVGVLGAQLFDAYAQQVFFNHTVAATNGLLDNPVAPFFGATGPGDAENKRDLAVQAALAEADALIRDTLGTDRSNWKWGKLHTIIYNHPLASVDSRFALPSKPVVGDSTTLNNGGFYTHWNLLALSPEDLAAAGGPFLVYSQDIIAASRAVWDLKDFNDSLGVLSTGESGNPLTPHWADHAPLWRSGQFFQFDFDEF